MPAVDIEESLASLRALRHDHGVEAPTLIPDLALMGLVDDTIDAVEEAQNLVAGPHRAYAMARIAFEAAQRLMVLGTSDDYMAAGCPRRAVIAAIAAIPGLASAAQVERDIYRALCGDAHARIRLQPRSLTIDSDGVVDVVALERPASEVAETVRAHVKTILGDVITALSFRTTKREADALKATAAAAEGHPRYSPKSRRNLDLTNPEAISSASFTRSSGGTCA